ncbi:carbonic anhydrase 14-like isoform X2 [Anneissia japonica]|uniref:carbonic anhydrase 14-like isoform X1 n=1 Tax=Anneissia japonica TaxID=1529436 RepID=UPI001425AF2E|nr:carbonic anhydrase 14-like isoform X1 [Anneissia japonica]XP_033115427.1 carbonic anhydrase 14-like isoform X2 [Anneissia japonica]
MDIFITVVLFLATVSNTAGQDWSYTGDTGPSYWAVTYPACGGEKQSPINIDTDDVEKDNLGTFTMVGFDDTNDKSMIVENNGKELQVNLVGDYSISGGGLQGSYLPVQFHFHWGRNLQEGSEHLVDSTAYPAEMHIVHYSDRFASLADAINDPAGLAILGVFIEESTEDNSNFDTIFGVIDDVRYPGNQTAIQVFNLENVFPDDLTKFYRYNGSLTTPGCQESIVWTVFKESISLSNSQIELFRTLVGDDGNTIQHNFRPPQQLNGRKVVFSNPDYDPSHGSVLVPSLLVSIFSIVILTFLK